MDKPVTDQVLYKHMYNTAHAKSDFQDEIAAQILYYLPSIIIVCIYGCSSYLVGFEFSSSDDLCKRGGSMP